MVGQGLTVLAAGAGGNCSDILFLLPIISLFFFHPLSEMNGWVTCGLCPVPGHWVDDWWLYAMKV